MADKLLNIQLSSLTQYWQQHPRNRSNWLLSNELPTFRFEKFLGFWSLGNNSLKNQFSRFWGPRLHAHSTHKAYMFFKSLLPTHYWERQPSKPLPTLEDWGSKDLERHLFLFNNQLTLKTYDIHELHVWDEHAASDSTGFFGYCANNTFMFGK